MTDKEYLDKQSTVAIYAEILGGIYRYTPLKERYDEKKHKIELARNLKFNKISDPDLFKACIDLIEDSQFAIDEFNLNGLITNHDTFGERYLRLYGILNAVYLQLGAILDLIRLFNVSDQKQIKNRLNSLKIIEVRNKIASHTTNYKIPNTKNEKDFFKLAQSTIDQWGNSLLIVSKDDSEYIDLKQKLNEFTKEIMNVLKLIVNNDLYNRQFKQEHFEWMQYRNNYIKNYR